MSSIAQSQARNKVTFMVLLKFSWASHDAWKGLGAGKGRMVRDPDTLV